MEVLAVLEALKVLLESIRSIQIEDSAPKFGKGKTSVRETIIQFYYSIG